MKETDQNEPLAPAEQDLSLDDGNAAAPSKSRDNEVKKHSSSDNSDEEPSFATVIKKQAIEEEQPHSRNFALLKILGGEILITKALRRQVVVFLLITGFVVLYIGNRYRCQQRLIEIDTLERSLKDIRYRALSSSSTLTEMSRESRILDALKHNGDSLLKLSKQPPYIINVPKE